MRLHYVQSKPQRAIRWVLITKDTLCEITNFAICTCLHEERGKDGVNLRVFARICLHVRACVLAFLRLCARVRARLCAQACGYQEHNSLGLNLQAAMRLTMHMRIAHRSKNACYLATHCYQRYMIHPQYALRKSNRCITKRRLLTMNRSKKMFPNWGRLEIMVSKIARTACLRR